MIYSMIVSQAESAILSTKLFIIWIFMGILIYASYGYRKNRQAEVCVKDSEKNEQITSNI